MDLSLSQLKVVVAGGSAGIGATVVAAFAREGCEVWFCARNEARVERFLAEIAADSRCAGTVHGATLDILDKAGVEAWLASIGNFDILISSVSALSGDWKRSIQTDMTGTINLVQAAEPYLVRSKHAALTYIGSKASSFATPGFDAYGAVKAAMAHFMKSTAARLIGRGVRVNVVSPGDTFVADGFWDTIRQNTPEIYTQTLQSNPLGRFCTPEEVADTVVFISSPRASFVAGSNWYVDGGATSHIQI